MILPHPSYSVPRGRLNELRMLGLLYEEGCCTAKQLGQFTLGNTFNPRNGFHHRILRRLRKASQIGWLTGPIKERLYYLKSEGAARLKEEGAIPADYYLGYTDYHSGRSGMTILHDLGVVSCRLQLESTSVQWVPKSIVQAASSKHSTIAKAIPDAIVCRPSDLDYWPEFIPFSLEYERSSKSQNDRILKIHRSQSLLGKRVAGIILITRQSQVDLWTSTIKRLESIPNADVMTRLGKRTIHFSPSLLRFWTISTPEHLTDAIAKSRAAYSNDGVTPFPWSSYSPWVSWWHEALPIIESSGTPTGTSIRTHGCT